MYIISVYINISLPIILFWGAWVFSDFGNYDLYYNKYRCVILFWNMNVLCFRVNATMSNHMESRLLNFEEILMLFYHRS